MEKFFCEICFKLREEEKEEIKNLKMKIKNLKMVLKMERQNNEFILEDLK